MLVSEVSRESLEVVVEICALVTCAGVGGSTGVGGRLVISALTAAAAVVFSADGKGGVGVLFPNF